MPVLRELNLDQNDLEEIPAEFRSVCGCGVAVAVAVGGWVAPVLSANVLS
jgi:translation initiation factor 1 (eIF-1/SUI1)